MGVALGILSGVLSTFGYVPYIVDTLQRKTQPERGSWLIWSTIGSIAFLSQVDEGATDSLWFAGVQVSGTIAIFVLSITRGYGDYLSPKNRFVFSAATLGLVAWYLTDSAVYALAISILIGLLGGVGTVIKAYQDPGSETLSTWVLALLASVCAVFAVGKLDWVLLAFPLYLLTLYIAIVASMLLGSWRLHARGEPSPEGSMMKQHLSMHGQTWRTHFHNNWRFSVLALKAAAFTFGHGLTSRVSGGRASELHNELWDLGRLLSIEDITHRLEHDLYSDRDEALEDFETQAALYNETARLEPFRAIVEEHFDRMQR